ncbi:MAG: WXG100 family type VII secretion target [Mycobacteriales bacterium]
MILRVDPTELTRTARPLRDAVDVGRRLQAARGELAGQLTGMGSEPVRRAAETFLDAWAVGLQAVSDRADTLATVLDAAAAGYTEAEERTRRQAGATGLDGVPA